MLPVTHHAHSRLQQRGIPVSVIENLLEFGRQIHDHRGGTILFFDHKTRGLLRRGIARDTYTRIESRLDAYAVIGADGVIV